MRRALRLGSAVIGVVALGGAGALAATRAPAPVGGAGPAPAVPVAMTSVVCPNLLAGYTGSRAGSGRAVRVALATAGPAPAGSVTRAPVGRTGVDTVTASGPGAGGITTTVTATGTGTARAASRALCVAPAATTWFAGPGTGAGADPLLTLTNPGPGPARADIAVVTGAGAAGDNETGAAGDSATGADLGGDSATGDPMGMVDPGVGVPAGSTVTVRLAALAPEATATAVRVTVREGRLATSLLDRDSVPGPGRNVAAVPPSAAPSRTVLIPGEAAGPGRRVLVIAAPTGDAMVRVEQVGAGSRYSPVGLAAVAVAAGTVTRLDLGRAPAADGSVLATVTAGAPVLAALGLTSSNTTSANGTAPARTWLAPVPPPAGAQPSSTTVVAVPGLPAGNAGEVVIATGSGGGRARLDTGAAVALPAGRTVTIGLPPRYRGGTLTITGAGTGGAAGGAVAQILRRAGATGAGPGAALVLPPAVDAVRGVTVLDDPRAAAQR